MTFPECFRSGLRRPRVAQTVVTSLVALAAMASLSVTAAQPAQPKALPVIQTPPQSAIAGMASVPALHGLALANLIASNCAIEGLEAGDAALIGGTAQVVAQHLGVGSDEYFSVYINGALREFGAADACHIHAASTLSLASSLKAQGGAVLNRAELE